MQFNGNTVTAYGTVDTPWSADFAEVMEAVDAQAGQVEQNTADIEALKKTITGSTMTEILKDGAVTEYYFAPADFDMLLVGATPASGHLTACATMPAAMATVGMAFQIADEESFSKWSLTSAGITRTAGTGTLTYIYGIKL